MTPNSLLPLIHEHLTDIACAALILVYAWDRFNTPSTNRSSTRRALYWEACLGYLVSALVLYAALSALLGQADWRSLLGLQEAPALPAPLLATLVMTTLMPRVPLVNQIDRRLLDFFLECAAIPAEAKRRAASLTPPSLSLTAADIDMLRGIYDDAYGDSFAAHLRDHGERGLERARLRFTRIVKIYAELQLLAELPRYSRFFAENADQFAALGEQVEKFIRSAVDKLDLAARLEAAASGPAFDELMEERYDSFAEACREQFSAMARFLAQAVLRSEPGERQIVARLRRLGFAEAEPLAFPAFPLNSLTGLALGLFGYFVLSGWLFSNLVPHGPASASPLAMAAKITLVRVSTLMLSIWLTQRYAFFRRAPGEPPRYFAYLVNGGAAGGLTAAITGCLHLIDTGVLYVDTSLVLLSVVLCSAVAFCCDDWTDESCPPPRWRVAEAIGCAAAMSAGMVIVIAGGLASFAAQSASLTLAYIGLPGVLGLIVGGCVPHIYREAQRAAAAKAADPTGPARRPTVQPLPRQPAGVLGARPG